MAYYGYDPSQYLTDYSGLGKAIGYLGEAVGAGVQEAEEKHKVREALRQNQIAIDDFYNAVIQNAESQLTQAGDPKASRTARSIYPSPTKLEYANTDLFLDRLSAADEKLDAQITRLRQQQAAATTQQLTQPQPYQVLGQPEQIAIPGGAGFTETPIEEQGIRPPQATTPIELQTQLMGRGYTTEETEPLVSTFAEQQKVVSEGALKQQREQRLRQSAQASANAATQRLRLSARNLDLAERKQEKTEAKQYLDQIDINRIRSDVEALENLRKYAETEYQQAKENPNSSPIVLEELKGKLDAYKVREKNAAKILGRAIKALELLGSEFGEGASRFVPNAEAQIQAEVARLRARGDISEQKIQDYIIMRRQQLGAVTR